ncbi:MAG: hypothetical protein IT285_01050 [Bdellovibrionales bacterium]|nr:hypothetical protein [Bdellovibrionales bacterium]
MWSRLLIAAWMVGFLSACTGGGGPLSPKKRLETYVSHSFAVSDAGDRSKLASFLTGDALDRLQAWSDDEFKAAFVDNKRKFHSLRVVRQTAVSAEEVTIEYELTYFDKSGQYEARVANRKLAELVLIDRDWLIKQVRNVQEVVEYKDALTLP